MTTREAFETEARKHGFILDRLDKSSVYVQLITEQAWSIWQATIAAALSAPATAPDEQLRKDSERYRWLRSQHWSDGQLSVVVNAKASVRLGANCPSHELLDEAIDSAMKGKL